MPADNSCEESTHSARSWYLALAFPPSIRDRIKTNLKYFRKRCGNIVGFMWLKTIVNARLCEWMSRVNVGRLR